MVSVLISILADFAASAKAFFSGFGLEALGAVALVVILKIGAEYCKNRVEVDWGALHLVGQAKSLSQIMSLEWEPYAFLTRHLLIEQGYRTAGSFVNDLSGVDILAEKDGKRTMFRFGRSTAETIYAQEIQDLLIRAHQFNASAGCMVTPGNVSKSVEGYMNNIPITLVKRFEFIKWLNQYAGAKLYSAHKIDHDVNGFGLSSQTSSDNESRAA